MHIPDGFIDLRTSAAFAAVSAVAVAGAVKGARKQLSEQSAPLAGLTAVFIFAVQMLNFPVAAGTSGHLIGAALAMVLVGPYAATLALVVVLIIQAFLFADGGLTALGLSVWVSFGTFVILKKILPKTKTFLVFATFVSALISVPAAAIGFVAQYALGANATFSVGTVLNAMVGTHIIIGIGEAVITALTVSAVLASRSDLVYGWDQSSNKLEIRS